MAESDKQVFMTKREKTQLIGAGTLALAGAILMVVRIWGLRFSGFLLVGTAGALLLDLLLGRWERNAAAARRCRKAFRSILMLGVILLALIECFVVYEGRRKPQEADIDAMVILGAGVNGRTPSLSLRTRLDAALEELEKRPEIPVVLSGGMGYGEEITEAQCMYEYLTAHGVYGGRVLLEECAENTAENFSLSKSILQTHGVNVEESTVAVVSNDFHLARAKLIASKQGYGEVVGVPAELPWVHLEVNYYLREAFAVVKTLIFD